MVELVSFIAKSLVTNPDAVNVKEYAQEDGNATVIELRVAEEDMGKVIGKQGRIAKAIRMLVKSASAKSGVFYQVVIEANEN